jgi:hypothetical protein
MVSLGGRCNIFNIKHDLRTEDHIHEIIMTFEFLEVTVKLYGIPSMFRTEDHIHAIINLIGHPSDWHKLNPRFFTANPHFVAVKVKLDATKPVIDKIFYPVPPVGNLGTIVIWVHYEKIKRICTFCAKLFHNAEHCPDRIQRILAAGEDINFDQYGLWMTHIHRIPMQLVETQLTSYQDILPGPSSSLSELRQAFAGVRMGTSLVMQPRRQQPSQTQASTQLTSPVYSAPLQTANVNAAEAMNVDNSAIVPLRTVMVTTADNMHVDTSAMLPLSTHLITSTPPQLQSQRLRTHGQLNSSSMLQFNQFNIRQTQVRVQVTTQPAMVQPWRLINVISSLWQSLLQCH